MRTCSDYKEIARDVLQRKWTPALLVGLVASILGGVSEEGSGISFNYNEASSTVNLEIAGQNIYSASGSLDSGLAAFLAGSALYITVFLIVFAVITFVLGSIVEIGYAKVNLNLLQRQEPSFDTLFSYMPFWQTAIASRFLRTLYTLLWTLLFIIPGIVASYSYSMTSYILAENPNLTASEAIAQSKQMMEGHRMDFFILELSFIGWRILSALTLGIGNLWLRPYRQAAYAAFYKDLTGAGLL